MQVPILPGRPFFTGGNLDRDQLVKSVLAAQELERRKREAPLIYFKLHPGQQRAHAAVTSMPKGRKRIFLLRPGNRFGKSTLAAAWLVSMMYGYWIFAVPGLRLTPEGDYPPRSTVPAEYWVRRCDGLPIQIPSKVLCITGSSFRNGIGETVHPIIEGMLPPAVRQHLGYRVPKGAFGVPVQMRLPVELSSGGSYITYASSEQDEGTFESTSFDAVVADEAFEQRIFSGVWRGMTDRCAPLLIPFTPIGKNAPWVYREFIASGRQDVIEISGSIRENPHLTNEAVSDFLEGGGFDEAERSARETGAWSFLTHRCFPTFDHSAHVVPADTPVPIGAIRGLAVDPAHRRPFMLVWAAFTDDGILIYDEWPEDDHAKMNLSTLTVPDYAKIIRDREAGFPADFRLLDPRFGKAQPRTKGEVQTSIQEDFAAQQLFFDCYFEGTEREEIGIERIRAALRYDRKAPLSALNRPILRVRANCINVINALHLSDFVPPARDLTLPEKTQTMFKDARDCVRYLLLYPWQAMRDYARTVRGGGYYSARDLEDENSSRF